MGNILPVRTIQGYEGICSYCLKIIKVNAQGTPSNHICYTKCPECLNNCKNSELDMFSGLCEECSGAFD